MRVGAFDQEPGPGVLSPPPSAPPPHPRWATVEPGTRFWRIHGPHAADAFNPTPAADPPAGGRFDTRSGDPAYLYVADRLAGCIAETLARSLPDTATARRLPRVALAGRRVSVVETVRPLRLLVAHGAALTHLGAPLALTKCGPTEYADTRAWAAAFRDFWPEMDGIAYRARHDEDERVLVLYQGRGATEPVRVVHGPVPLEIGAATVHRELLRYNTVL